MGADLPRNPRAVRDPRLKELVDEIVRLSTEFGILTEYTAFLAREGTDLTRRNLVLEEARRNFEKRAMRTRHGLASFNQESNFAFQRGQRYLNRRNYYQDRNMNRVQVTGVQQVNDRAFYNRGGRWTDSRLLAKGKKARPDEVVKFGSEEFRKLVRRLVQNGRQGSVALRGEVLMEVDGKTVLVQ